MQKLEGEPTLHNFDATVWAREFNRMHGGDQELMLSWFANAIMAGYDHAKREKATDVSQGAASGLAAIVRVAMDAGWTGEGGKELAEWLRGRLSNICPGCDGEGEVHEANGVPGDEGWSPCPVCGGTKRLPTWQEIGALRREAQRLGGDLQAAEGELAIWKEQFGENALQLSEPGRPLRSRWGMGREEYEDATTAEPCTCRDRPSGGFDDDRFAHEPSCRWRRQEERMARRKEER